MSNIYISSLGRYAIGITSFRFEMDQKINDYKNAQTCFWQLCLCVHLFQAVTYIRAFTYLEYLQTILIFSIYLFLLY